MLFRGRSRHFLDKERRTLKALAKLIVVAALLVGLPLLSAGAVDASWAEMFELPPRSQYVSHAPFSWTAFAGYCAFALACVLPFLIRAMWASKASGPRLRRRPFPWWGWMGVALGAAGWVLAWNRFTWFSVFQRHTFACVWFPYIVVVNALTFRRTGRCLALGRPRFFLLLFPLSAVFWWFFEYLNRFVQNWRYVEVHVGGAGETIFRPLDFSPTGYVVYATIAFSTVLPAVLSTRELLLSFSVFQKFRSFQPTKYLDGKRTAWVVLLITGAGLACIGAFPNHLFPLLWMSPLLVVVSVQTLWGDRHVFSDVRRGDWRPAVSAALAALVCGFFWEMWNCHSMARWLYAVPLIQRFQLFEMPLIGYAGYLPFGLQCAVLGDILGPTDRPASALSP